MISIIFIFIFKYEGETFSLRNARNQRESADSLTQILKIPGMNSDSK